MYRLLFEKTGNAVWISHLDLMRVFQRAFKRAGLALTHTQGYNPRPSVSIALPLSVGTQSYCELLDFELEGCELTPGQIRTVLNSKLIAGVRVREVYENGAKLKYLQYLTSELTLCYDRPIPEDALEQILSLFSQSSLTVSKKGKNGIQQVDIVPMIRSLEGRQQEQTVQLTITASCQNPSLNPMLAANAVSAYLPHLTPDHVLCCRMQVLDQNGDVFR